MKRKTFIKLVCVILCILTVVCSSGCFEKINQLNQKQVIESMEKNKSIAKTFIPQCTDYSLKILPSNFFEDDEERLKQGFFNGAEMKMYNTHIYIVDDFIKIRIGDNNYEIHKEFVVGISIFNDFSGLDNTFYFDNKFFFFTQPTVEFSSSNKTSHAPALYLFDVEKEQLLFCGCAMEYYDFHVNGLLVWNDGFEGSDFIYKIVKNKENWNEKNK